MAESFDWQKDWFFWGQDRLGSFLPLIASLFVGLGLNALNAVVIAQFIILCTTVACFLLIAKNRVVTLLFTVILFYPIYPFWVQNSLGHPYISQFMFTLILIALFYRLKSKPIIFLSLFPFVALLAIWSSEMSFALILALIIVEYRWFFQQSWRLLFLVPGARLSQKLWNYAKENAVSVDNYQEFFATPSEVVLSIRHQLNLLSEVLLWQSNKPFNSLYSWGLILICLFLIARYVQLRKVPNKLTLVFILSALGSWLMVHLSHWNSAMDFPLRYYTTAHFYGLLAFLLTVKDKIFVGFRTELPLLLLAALHALASYHFFNGFDAGAHDRIDRLQAEKLLEISTNEQRLDSLGIIGSYWNTYLLDALSEDAVAIPRIGDQVRDYRVLNSVKNQRDFLIIGNQWLTDFPDTIKQYQLNLIKVSQVERIDEIEYAFYQNPNPPTQNKPATSGGSD